MIDISKKEIEVLMEASKTETLSIEHRKIIIEIIDKLKNQNNIAELFVDGASDLHSKTGGIGGVVFLNGNEIYSFSEPLIEKTNNEAEYLALIKGIYSIIDLNINNINIYSDSQLIVNQVKGDYKIKNDRMIELHSQVMDALKNIDTWSINHIRREKNKRADILSKNGMNQARSFE